MAGLELINMLPKDCVSIILSLTSPSDACRSSLVSSTFRSAADSDVVWERFLTSDYWDIVSRSVTPLKFSSKQELFFCLCNPILIDGGNKISEVAVLKSVSQLEIQGKIKTQMLSPSTTYGAYLILKISDAAYGLDSIPSEISIEVDNSCIYKHSISTTCRPQETTDGVPVLHESLANVKVEGEPRGRYSPALKEKMGGWRLSWESPSMVKVMRR
ncbi:hypothetical protein F0562_019909 [Nyssa sinensis]|uniref:F-box domain-containing protein n=1 Tax=Nyssa sinensis TaxID=561372 RepID=A0A5J5BTY5_9ASTE|nr:hypothetical protein F0562_019909 [Nyssa sinensis]